MKGYTKPQSIGIYYNVKIKKIIIIKKEVAQEEKSRKQAPSKRVPLSSAPQPQDDWKKYIFLTTLSGINMEEHISYVRAKICLFKLYSVFMTLSICV